MTIEPRWIVYVVWGIGTSIIWGAVLYGAFHEFRKRRDRRARRELLSFTGLFLTALGSSFAILLVLLGEPGQAMRTFVLAFSLGMFTGAGVVMLGSRRGDL
jgi:hypothetical protein